MSTASIIGEQFAFWHQVPELPPLATSLPVVVVGCGSSFHLAQAIAAAFCVQGRRALAVPAGEWTRRPGAYVTAADETFHVLALSRSGETSETVQACEASREAGHRVTALVCDGASTLAALPGAIVLPTHPEEGIVMTASASVLLLAGLRLAGASVGAPSIDAAQSLLATVQERLPAIVAGRDHVVFLGGGGLHGVAQEGAIKMQEMSLTFAQAYHPLEYRHGPISLVDDHTLVVALFDEDAQPEELRLAAEIADKGGRVLSLGGPGETALMPGGEPLARGLVCLPVIQALGEAMAQAKGIDTTAPRHLSKVVILP